MCAAIALEPGAKYNVSMSVFPLVSCETTGTRRRSHHVERVARTICLTFLEVALDRRPSCWSRAQNTAPSRRAPGRRRRAPRPPSPLRARRARGPRRSRPRFRDTAHRWSRPRRDAPATGRAASAGQTRSASAASAAANSRRRQVMMAGPLVAQRAVDQHEIRRRPHWGDLTGRGYADQQPAAGDEQLLRHQHGERRAHGKAHDADRDPVMLRHIHFGVIAGPAVGRPRPPAGTQRAHDVAVRVECAHRRHRRFRQPALAACLTQQVLRPEYRRRVVRLRRQMVGCLVRALPCRLPVAAGHPGCNVRRHRETTAQVAGWPDTMGRQCHAAGSAARRGTLPDPARLVHAGVLAAAAGQRRHRPRWHGARSRTALAARHRRLGSADADGRDVVAADAVEDPAQFRRPEATGCSRRRTTPRSRCRARWCATSCCPISPCSVRWSIWWKLAIAVSLLLGLFSRAGALLGLLMGLNLWLGLYSADNEWPWTYMFLVMIQAWFVIDPPGRVLGADALPRSPWRRASHPPSVMGELMAASDDHPASRAAIAGAGGRRLVRPADTVGPLRSPATPRSPRRCARSPRPTRRDPVCVSSFFQPVPA